MSMELLIAGGGMAGLAAATACAAAGLRPRVLDQAQAFAEVGAGVQLGPNATRRLVRWGLGPALLEVAAQPANLRVRSAAHGGELARMPLGEAFERRYGGPYVTIHRADLHAVLLGGARHAGVPVELASRVESVAQDAQGVRVSLGDGRQASAPVLLGADGLWSNVRQQVWRDGLARPAGHLAYRGVVAQKDLPLALRSGDVTAWLGPKLHVVTYPLRRGELLNVVAIVEGRIEGDAQDWDHAAVLADLQKAMGVTCDTLRDLTQAVPAWRLWVLCDRMPLGGPQAMAQGRVALLGDAAHPMRPYLAQGACMAIEDADALAGLLAGCAGDPAAVPGALQRYAAQRWERCARVQWRSRRNGDIFHAVGPMRWGRDTALRLLGQRILDVPWLYGPG